MNSRNTTMTSDSRKRLLTAMDNKVPDRVPVMCQLSLGHYFLYSGLEPADIWFDSEVFAKALVKLQQQYEFDGILINLSGRPPDWRKYIASSSRRNDSTTISWKNSGQTVIPDDDNPRTYTEDCQPLPRADFNSFDPSDPRCYRAPGYIWNIYHAPALWQIPEDADLADTAVWPEWFTSALANTVELAGNISIHAEVFWPFTHFLELFGYERALMALIENPEKCHKILKKLTDHVRAHQQLYSKIKPDAILVSSAFAGAGFISRKMYEDFVLPYERCIHDFTHQLGFFTYVHTCGAIGDRLDLMAETGTDGIDTLDPPPVGTVELKNAKEQFGDRLFFKGNLDGVNDLLNADDSQFERAVLNRLEWAMPGGGYILSTACSVPPYVKPQRLKKLSELAKTHGKYK